MFVSDQLECFYERGLQETPYSFRVKNFKKNLNRTFKLLRFSSHESGVLKKFVSWIYLQRALNFVGKRKLFIHSTGIYLNFLEIVMPTERQIFLGIKLLEVNVFTVDT
jgi:hypothetical protein